MPTLNDFDKNDEESGGLDEGYTPAQSAAVGSATGGSQQAPRTQAEPQGYVPWSSFASANEDVSKREAGKLSSQVAGDVSKAQRELSAAEQGFNAGIDNNYGISTSTKQAAPSNSKTQGERPAAQGGLGAGEMEAPPPAVQQLTAGATPPEMRAEAIVPDKANPWEGFLEPDTAAPAAQAPATAGGRTRGGAPPAPQLDSLRPFRLSEAAAGGHPTGSKDLEAAAGSPAWSSLLGDTMKASQEAHALGSETGVQSLLQQGQTSPMGNSAFDAALINGPGQRDFQAEAQRYGGNQLQKGVVNAEQASQDRWKQLQGDVASRQASDKAANQPAPAAAPGAATPAAAAPVDPYTGLLNAATTHHAIGDGSDPTGTWSQGDADAWDTAFANGQQTADANKGKPVRIAAGQNNQGIGTVPNTTQSGINVHVADGGETPSESDYRDWWGGASATAVGDPSISAATWYALASLSPAQRAKWWAHNHPAGGK